MLLVGLTGGVASGKSTVAGMLAEKGAAVLDADCIVARLYAGGQPGAAAVAEMFGTGMLAPDGSVDRGRLAARVLNDKTARTRLEAAVHPLVRAEIGTWLEHTRAQYGAHSVAVVEAALLVETGGYRDYDALVVVTAPRAVRRARALAAGWSAERFEGTVAAQATDASRRRIASFVIVNDGDLGRLERRVGRLWKRLIAAAAQAGERQRPHRVRARG